jgi:two-component system sensor histidine kinase TctE
VGQQLLILALATLCILFGLHRGLAPLIRLRNDVRSRQEGSLKKLDTHKIPTELTPLVDAFNDYMQRLENYTQLRSTFIQNAAHQLRTPLAVLNIQISDSLRADSKQSGDVSLLAARKTLQQTTRLVNQFLSLSSAEAHVVERSAMSTQACCDIVQKVLEDLAPQAHRKMIDLGLERSGPETVISSSPSAWREIAINLIDNAIRYTPVEGVVTVRIDSADTQITLVVEDNGPGVAPENQDAIFQRFFRIAGTNTAGSGLGLAIVKELVAQCGGVIRVCSPLQHRHGLSVSIDFPQNIV